MDVSAKDANARANQSSVDLERATTREIANQERIAELRTRAAAGSAELEQARLHLQGLIVERESHRSFLETPRPKPPVSVKSQDSARSRHAMRPRQSTERNSGWRLHGAMPCSCSPRLGMRATRPCMRKSRLTALEQDAERLASEISRCQRGARLAGLGTRTGFA